MRVGLQARFANGSGGLSLPNGVGETVPQLGDPQTHAQTRSDVKKIYERHAVLIDSQEAAAHCKR